jgi:hypothetical protein
MGKENIRPPVDNMQAKLLLQALHKTYRLTAQLAQVHYCTMQNAHNL